VSNAPRIFGGVDLSQSALGLVAVPVPFQCEWDRVERTTFGLTLGREHSREELAQHLQTMADTAVCWLKAKRVTDVAFEAYPLGSGALRSIDRVAEIGGALRYLVWTQLGLAPTASPIASARKLFLGSMSHAYLAHAVRHMRPAEVKKLGKQKAAVWAEAQRMRCGFGTPDEADAFVAANWGMHEQDLPAVASVGGMAA
jgi:hypothetical protein